MYTVFYYFFCWGWVGGVSTFFQVIDKIQCRYAELYTVLQCTYVNQVSTMANPTYLQLLKSLRTVEIYKENL
jgi:hypothetical protein